MPACSFVALQPDSLSGASLEEEVKRLRKAKAFLKMERHSSDRSLRPLLDRLFPTVFWPHLAASCLLFSLLLATPLAVFSVPARFQSLPALLISSKAAASALHTAPSCALSAQACSQQCCLSSPAETSSLLLSLPAAETLPLQSLAGNTTLAQELPKPCTSSKASVKRSDHLAMLAQTLTADSFSDPLSDAVTASPFAAIPSHWSNPPCPYQALCSTGISLSQALHHAWENVHLGTLSYVQAVRRSSYYQQQEISPYQSDFRSL